MEGFDELLSNYHPSKQTVELLQETPVVLLVGISGAGKGTIKAELEKSDKFYNFVSHTTRAPRKNGDIMEQDGVEYHFITYEESKRMLQSGEYIEAKRYGDNIYGTSVEELHKAHSQGKIIINDIEIQGVREYVSMSSNVKAIFLIPPDYDTWINRIAKRYKSSDITDDIRKRMQIAEHELREVLSKDFYYFVVNDKLEDAVDRCWDIIKNQTSDSDNVQARLTAQKLLDSIAKKNKIS